MKLETDFPGGRERGSRKAIAWIEVCIELHRRIFRREGRDSRTFGPAPDARNPMKSFPPEIRRIPATGSLVNFRPHRPLGHTAPATGNKLAPELKRTRRIPTMSVSW